MSIDYDSIAEFYDVYVTADCDLPFFLTATAEAGGAVLELAAGTGRLPLPLAAAGVRLTCVDASMKMLAVLSRKLAERGLHAGVCHADICDLRLNRIFDLARMPFQAYMEILGEDRQRRAMSAIADCLGPGGRFICTLHNPAVRRSTVDGVFRVVGHHPHGDGTLLVSGVEQGGAPVVRRLQFFEMYDADGMLRSKRMLPMAFELIDKERLEAMAREAGFEVLALYGSYDRAPFDAARSAVMIWDLQRRRE